MAMTKRELHTAIQEHSRSQPALSGGLVTRWALVVELAIPDADMVLHRLSGDGSARPLTQWDVDGLLFAGIMRNRAQEITGGTP